MFVRLEVRTELVLFEHCCEQESVSLLSSQKVSGVLVFTYVAYGK